jgi:hypothetical protein
LQWVFGTNNFFAFSLCQRPFVGTIGTCVPQFDSNLIAPTPKSEHVTLVLEDKIIQAPIDDDEPNWEDWENAG